MANLPPEEIPWQNFPRGGIPYGKASPSMVNPPPPHKFHDEGRHTMADPPPPSGNYIIWQTFPMKEYHMANLLHPEEIP